MEDLFEPRYEFPYNAYRDDNNVDDYNDDDDDDDDLSLQPQDNTNTDLPPAAPPPAPTNTDPANTDLPPAPPAPSPEERARMRLRQLLEETSSDEDEGNDTPPASAPAAGVQRNTPTPAAAVVPTGEAVQRARMAYRKAELDNSLSTFKKLMHAHVFPYMKYVPKYDSLTTSAESETFFFFSDGYCGGDGDPALLREAVERWKRHRPKIREIVRSKRGSAVASIKEGLAGKDTIVCSFGFYH